MRNPVPDREESEPAAASDDAAPTVSYVLPLRSTEPRADLVPYLEFLASIADVIVVDGSPATVFTEHARLFRPPIRHVPVDSAYATPNGKVGGVLAGVRHARHEHVVIADDDVRYTEPQLRQLSTALADVDLVRPQNWFDPLPWHARWDTGRILCNRVLGGDWPGTLGVRRSILCSTGYDGQVLFENLELVRTIEAAGGRTRADLSLLVRRAPPSTKQFFDQRVRQAYDEFARPARMAAFLAILPLVIATRGRAAPPIALAAVTLAELGRRRAGGTRVFPATSALWAPLWVAERAVTSWLAVGSRLAFGGVRYRGNVLRVAATPRRRLASRFAR